MARSSSWTNSDGLVVGFGTHSVDNNVPGVTSVQGSVKTITVLIKASDLPDAFAATNISPQTAWIRRGSVIRSATLQATTAWTGTGTLDIGLWGRTAVDDADGIDATIDVDAALAAVGDIVECDGALVGGVSVSALSVGETCDTDCTISAEYNGTVSAGEAVLTIEYIEPRFASTLAV